MIIIPTVFSFPYAGYIAGTGDGIVTALGEPASKPIWLLSASTMKVKQMVVSLNNGHYQIMGLNPAEEYLVITRDHKKEYEPFVWDYVKPANDLTIEQQQALWQTWQ